MTAPASFKEQGLALPAPKKATPKIPVMLEQYLDHLTIKGGAIPTGYPTPDAAMRGGLRAGMVTTFVAGPGSFKTGWVANILYRLSRRGYVTGFVAHDEGAPRVAMRYCQLAGGSRDDLERDDAKGERARAMVADEIAGLPALLFNEEISLERAWEILRTAPGGTETTKVLAVDSIQQVDCEAARGIENPRERTDVVMRVLRSIASEGAVVLAISEMSRSGWARSRKENVNPLAAAKESSGIEFGVDVYFAMFGAKDSPGMVDVEIAKNRMGEKSEFRLRMDFASAEMTEVAMPDRDAREKAKEAAKLDEIAAKIAKKVRTSKTPIKSKNQLFHVMGGSRPALFRAVDVLMDEGRLEMTSTGFQWLDEGVDDDE